MSYINSFDYVTKILFWSAYKGSVAQLYLPKAESTL